MRELLGFYRETVQTKVKGDEHEGRNNFWVLRMDTESECRANENKRKKKHEGRMNRKQTKGPFFLPTEGIKAAKQTMLAVPKTKSFP